MRILQAEQRTPEWFAARLGKATASNFGNVLAAKTTAAYRNYRVRLALERLTGKQEDAFQSDAMKQGTEREPLARIAYEALTGNLVEEVGFCLHDTLDCGASPDGLIDAVRGLEIKCPTPGKHCEYLRIPAELVNLAAPGCSEKIVAREDPEKWGFPDLNELWSGFTEKAW